MELKKKVFGNTEKDYYGLSNRVLMQLSNDYEFILGLIKWNISFLLIVYVFHSVHLKLAPSVSLKLIILIT